MRLRCAGLMPAPVGCEPVIKRLAGRWGPPRESREERVLLLPAGYEADRLSRYRSLQAGRGKLMCSDQAGDSLLDLAGEVAAVLRHGVTTLFEV